MDNPMNFAAKLRYLMVRKGITQDALGQELGVSNVAVWKWLSGSIPRAQTAQDLADFFGVDINDLLDDSREFRNDSSPLTLEQKKEFHQKIAEVRQRMGEIEDVIDIHEQEYTQLRAVEVELVRRVTSEVVGSSIDLAVPMPLRTPAPTPPKVPGKSTGVRM